MNITEELANFIINCAVVYENGTQLISYNSETEGLWLKLAPKLNAISQRHLNFRVWMRVFSNWTRTILAKHRLKKPLSSHEKKYMELREKVKLLNQSVVKTEIPSTSAVNQTTTSKCETLDENFIKFAEKVTELAKHWDFKSITAELKEFNDNIEEKIPTKLEKYMCLTWLLTNLSEKLDGS